MSAVPRPRLSDLPEAPRARRLAPAAALAAFLGGLAHGCIMVGPDYETPPAPVAETWIDFQDARVNTEETDLRTWWSVFQDPILDALMCQAGEGSLTLQAAAERVSAARARRDLAAGFMYPQSQGASGGGGTTRLSEEDPNITPGFDRTSTQWSADVGASWEIDFWGRYRRAVESADAELQASVADYDDVMVLLYSEVASRYVSYRTFQHRLRYLRQNEEIQMGAYEVTQARFTAGEVAERDRFEALQVLEETRALIPDAELGLRIENNALCVLTGSPPRDLSVELGEGSIPVAPETVAVGIPADLLRRRPDVRRAERIAAARCALIGIAESDFYPRISVLGRLGVSAEHSSDLDESDAETSFLGTSFTWSLFDYGRTASNVQIFEAEFRAAVLDYEQAVLNAGQEAEDALYSLFKSRERLVPQAASADAAERTVQIVQDQYAEGEVDFSDVFLFASNLTEAQDELATAQGNVAQALVSVYRALGGGWIHAVPDDAATPGLSGETAQTPVPMIDGDAQP